MIKLNNLRNQERDTMRTALTVLSSLAATRAELIEAEQERCSEVIADAVKQEDAFDEVHQLLVQACARRAINTAGPTKELVARLAESGASMRQLEDDLAGARAELEAEKERLDRARELLRLAHDELDDVPHPGVRGLALLADIREALAEIETTLARELMSAQTVGATNEAL